MNNIVKRPLLQVTATASAPASATSPEQDPLAMPAGEVDTRFPRLQPDRVYRMTIGAVSKDISDKGNEMIVMKLQTTKDEVDTDGKPLHAGFPVFHRVMTTPTGERDIKVIARDLALVLKAVGKGSVSPRDFINNPEIVKDQLVDVKIGMQKAKDGYPESNKVSSFVPPS